jgi:hypothetical protein
MVMRIRGAALAAVGLAAVLFPAAPAAEKGGDAVTEEGFVRNWLVLAPIPLKEGQSGADAVAKEQLKDEAKLAPKEGDKVKVGDTELTWKKHRAAEDMLDFNGILGSQTEDSVGYAVCYLVAGEEMKGVKMKTGSDDQLRVYLNGEKVVESDQPRSAEKDQDTTEVTLRKGTNVLVCKVVNEKVDWALCVRFVDKDDKPVKNLKVRLTPKE